MQSRFKNDGLRVIAVNGYDDTHDAVSKLFKTKTWHHDALLNGQAVAHEKFFVESFPVTFLVSRQGLVTKRFAGFDASKAKKLEAEVVELLQTKTRK